MNGSDTKQLSLLHDIQERQIIVEKYMNQGILDRADAIRKIINLRYTDEVVGTELAVESARYPFTPLEYATNDQIIAELQKQITILTMELANSPSQNTR